MALLAVCRPRRSPFSYWKSAYRLYTGQVGQAVQDHATSVDPFCARRSTAMRNTLLFVALVLSPAAAQAQGPNAIRAGFNSTVYVNNNGNLTFDSPLSTFTPFNLLQTSRLIVAPFFADVDTRVGNLLTFGSGTLGGRSAFGVNWPGVGCYSVNVAVL